MPQEEIIEPKKISEDFSLQEFCPHEDIEEYSCINCGLDLSDQNNDAGYERFSERVFGL